MLYFSIKLLLLFLFITDGTVIDGIRMKENSDEESESLPDIENIEKELSTLKAELKELNEEEEENKEENVEFENIKAIETSDSNKESLEEEDAKEIKEIEKQFDSAKNFSTEETTNMAEIPFQSDSTVSYEIEETSSAAAMLVTELSIEKEIAPEDTFAVWNAKGKICILARFHVVFSIIYPSKGGEQKAEVTVPKHGMAKGKCEATSKAPLLQISWQKYVFTMIFNKTDEDSWIATSVELTYDTSDALFDGATNSGKKTARSKVLNLFETPLDKSFYCPAQEVVFLYSGNKQVVTARLKDVYLQPYGIEDGKFSTALRCSKVVIDGPDEAPYVQDETVPLAVGCTLALITLLILLGFSFHRAYNAAKVDYNTVE